MDGAFKRVSQLYGDGIEPEQGLDQPHYDTSILAERMQRFDEVPPWMKAIEPYDESLSHWLQASPWGNYPEAMTKKDMAIGPLGTLPWAAFGAGKMLKAPAAFDSGASAVREQMWDKILKGAK